MMRAMRRSFVVVSTGLSVFLLVLCSMAVTEGGGLLAVTGTSFQNSLSKTFRRRSTRTSVSSVPCIQRVKQEECAKGVVGGTCYWNARSKRCGEKKPECYDEDGGLNFFRASTTYGFDVATDTAADAHADYCENVRTGSGRVMTEYYCATDGLVAYLSFRCPLWCVSGACQRPKGPEGDTGEVPRLTQRVVELSSGVTPYHAVSASSYESEITLTPRYSFLFQRFVPSVSACTGQCTYEVTVSDSARRVLIKLIGKAKDGTDLSAGTDLPIQLEAKKRYYVLQRMTSDQSVTFGTTGPNPENVRANIEVVTSQSGTTDYRKWGTAIFAIEGMFVK